MATASRCHRAPAGRLCRVMKSMSRLSFLYCLPEQGLSEQPGRQPNQRRSSLRSAFEAPFSKRSHFKRKRLWKFFDAAAGTCGSCLTFGKFAGWPHPALLAMCPSARNRSRHDLHGDANDPSRHDRPCPADMRIVAKHDHADAGKGRPCREERAYRAQEFRGVDGAAVVVVGPPRDGRAAAGYRCRGKIRPRRRSS